MEFLDLYDQNRRPLGRQIERNAPRKHGEYSLIAAVWTADRNGKLLLTKRSPEKEFFPGEWENSGGAVLAGETSQGGAIRELFEETGLQADAEKLILLGSCREEYGFVDTYLFLLEEEEPLITLLPGETSASKWVTLAEYREMADKKLIIEPAVRQARPFLKQMEKLILEWAKKYH